MYSISFSPGETHPTNRIDIRNVYLPEVAPPIEAINAPITSAEKIDYPDKGWQRFEHLENEVREISLSKRYLPWE